MRDRNLANRVSLNGVPLIFSKAEIAYQMIANRLAIAGNTWKTESTVTLAAATSLAARTIPMCSLTLHRQG